MNRRILIVLVVILFNCGKNKPEVDTIAHQAEVDAWHARRVEELKGANGWLNVVGLYWLKEGINTFGCDERNSIVFPKGKMAGQAGYFLVQNGVVTMQTLPEANITSRGKEVVTKMIFHPDSTDKVVLESGSLQWFIIKRDNLFGVRLRDLESEVLKKFTAIERYPVEVAWRLEAELEVPAERKVLHVTNMLGQTIEQVSPGTVVFTWAGEKYRLDALEGNEDELFIIVGDETNGMDTYGAGRYIYVKKPGADGKVVLDFNMLYNPPCAFTAYATCLLPPEQNRLPFKVTAGEKNYEEEH